MRPFASPAPPDRSTFFRSPHARLSLLRLQFPACVPAANAVVYLRYDSWGYRPVQFILFDIVDHARRHQAFNWFTVAHFLSYLGRGDGHVNTPGQVYFMPALPV